MIIESPLALDRERHTSNLIAACEHKQGAVAFTREDIERLLVWHAVKPHVYVQVHELFGNLVHKTQALGFRVRLLSPRLASVSFYSLHTVGKIEAQLLLELAADGQLVRAEQHCPLHGGWLTSLYNEETAYALHQVMSGRTHWMTELAQAWGVQAPNHEVIHS